MLHLAAALRENRSVVVLDVGQNRFGDQGAKDLADALRAPDRPKMKALCYEPRLISGILFVVFCFAFWAPMPLPLQAQQACTFFPRSYSSA